MHAEASVDILVDEAGTPWAQPPDDTAWCDTSHPGTGGQPAAAEQEGGLVSELVS